jgi:hypothetical protein
MSSMGKPSSTPEEEGICEECPAKDICDEFNKSSKGCA